MLPGESCVVAGQLGVAERLIPRSLKVLGLVTSHHPVSPYLQWTWQCYMSCRGHGRPFQLRRMHNLPTCFLGWAA